MDQQEVTLLLPGGVIQAAYENNVLIGPLINRLLRAHFIGLGGDDYGLVEEKLDQHSLMKEEGGIYLDPIIAEIRHDAHKEWLDSLCDDEGEEWKRGRDDE